MGTWLVNDLTMDYLDIEDITINYANQDRDTAQILFHTNLETSLWAYGTEITIKLDNVIRFKGRLEGRRRIITPSGEQIQWTVCGAWWYFENIVYGRTNYHTNQNVFTSRFAVGATSIYAQTLELLNYVASLGYITVGDVAVNALSIPKEEVRDLTVAQALQRLLRWVPGTVVTFDYNAVKPICHVLDPNAPQLTEHMVTIGTSKLSGVEFAPRNDIRVPNVVLKYDRKFSLNHTVYDPTKLYVPFDVVDQGFHPTGTGSIWDPDDQSEGLFEYVGTDSYPNATLTAKTLFKTMTLAGSKRWRYWHYRQNNWTTGYSSLAYFQQHINNLRYLFDPWQSWMATPGQFAASDVGYEIEAASTVSGSANPSRLFLLPDEYQPPRELWASPQFMDGFQVWKVHYSAKWYQVSGSGVSHMNVSKYFFDAYSFNNVLRDWTWITRNMDESDTDLQAIPSGVAQSMYLMLNKDYYDGRIDLVDEEAVFLNPKARIANIAGYAKGTVQQISITASTGRTSITFGQPEHLGPTDLIELLKASKQ